MFRISPDKYAIRYHIRSFYELPDDTEILQLAFVFRNQNGAIVAKDTGDRDIFYPELEVLKYGPIEKADGADGIPLGTLKEIRQDPDGSLFLSDGNQALVLRSYGDKTLNIIYLPERNSIPYEAKGILPPFDPAEQLINPSGLEDVIINWVNGYEVLIQRSPIRISVYKDGRSVITPELGFYSDAANPATGLVRGLRLKLSEEEKLYGWGDEEHTGYLKGARIYPTETDMTAVLSSAGYGIYAESPAQAFFDIGKNDSSILEYGFTDAENNGFSVFFVLADNWLELSREMYRLSGKFSMRISPEISTESDIPDILTPYLNQTAISSLADGLPPQRPLLVHFPDDKNCDTLSDQFMFGPNILLAPVRQKKEFTDRLIYLPEGRWYDYHRHVWEAGEQWLDYLAEEQITPIFIREGSFIPEFIDENEQNFRPDLFTLAFYPGIHSENKGDIILYKGDISEAIESRRFAKMHCSADLLSNRMSIRISEAEGSVAEYGKEVNFVIRGLQNPPLKVKVNGKKLKNPNWDSLRRSISIKIQINEGEQRIELKGKNL